MLPEGQKGPKAANSQELAKTGGAKGRMASDGADYAWHAFNTRYLAFQAVAVAVSAVAAAAAASSCQFPVACVSLCPKSFVVPSSSAGYRSA